jgi:AcrR family transcriptional regulator
VPRAGLTPEKVVAEAAAVADELGWDRLTLATVAERLGVRLPSLYKHVASLEALRSGVRAHATRELAEAMTGAALGCAGGEALRAVADAYRDFARRHPGLYEASIPAPAADNPEHVAAAAAALAVIEAILRGYRLEGHDAIAAARALRAALHGFVHLEAGGGFGLPVDVDRSYARMVAGLDTTLRGWAR